MDIFDKKCRLFQILFDRARGRRYNDNIIKSLRQLPR